ncbi:MAG: PEP-CTERM sorting domain-containing protein [Nanoarchaeota archaeon]|nr:PEP-CTERM sorting domain-containing protein [Nanoarchaeota archaeon]
MGFMRNLAIGGLAVLVGWGTSVKATVFNPLFDETNPYVTLEGRMAFYIPNPLGGGEPPLYEKCMEDGKDEVGLFLDDGTCIGSTNQVSGFWDSHYDGLKMNSYFFDKFFSGEWNVEEDLTAKAYNSETKTIWDADIIGYSFDNFYGGRDHHVDIRAMDDTGVVPEPATIALLGLGALALRRKSKK